MSTQPTDDEIVALADATRTAEGGANGYILPISFARAVLAKWGTPVVAKWAPEEIADDERGIRWVTNEGIHGRPTDHDVREYLKRTPTAHGCHCDECKKFYTTPQPVREPLSIIDLMRVVMKADEESQDTRGTTNWAAHIGKAVQNAVLGITGGQHGTE